MEPALSCVVRGRRLRHALACCTLLSVVAACSGGSEPLSAPTPSVGSSPPVSPSPTPPSGEYRETAADETYRTRLESRCLLSRLSMRVTGTDAAMAGKRFVYIQARN